MPSSAPTSPMPPGGTGRGDGEAGPGRYTKGNGRARRHAVKDIGLARRFRGGVPRHRRPDRQPGPLLHLLHRAHTGRRCGSARLSPHPAFRRRRGLDGSPRRPDRPGCGGRIRTARTSEPDHPRRPRERAGGPQRVGGVAPERPVGAGHPPTHRAGRHQSPAGYAVGCAPRRRRAAGLWARWPGLRRPAPTKL